MMCHAYINKQNECDKIILNYLTGGKLYDIMLSR